MEDPDAPVISMDGARGVSAKGLGDLGMYGISCNAQQLSPQAQAAVSELRQIMDAIESEMIPDHD